MNIVKAEWAGFGSRTVTKLAARTKTIVATTDLAALDYYGLKIFYILSEVR